jgi:polar amino acid transport system substrate-binding protein
VKRIFSIALVCAALLLGLHGPAESHDDAPVLSRVSKEGEIRVGTSGSQPPFSMTAKSGELIGYEIDLAKLLADAMGVELKLVKMPFPELLPALEQGELDLVMSGMTMTVERNVKVAFEGPYIVSGKSILSTSAPLLAAIAVASDVNQEELTLTALRDSTSQRFVEMRLPKAKLVTIEDYDSGIKMVVEGKADAMVADIPICAISMLRYPAANLGMLPQPLTIEPIGVAMPAGDSLLLNLIENYLAALDSVGLLDKLEKRWFEDGTWVVRVGWD